MRRGRILTGAGALIVALCIGFAVAPVGASAASPMDICRAIASGNFNAGDYSQGDLAAYQDALRNDPTIQGYCSPLVIVPPPPPTTTTVCVQAGPNGTTVPCGQPVCAEGQTQTTGPNGEVVCQQVTTTTTTPAGVAGTTTTSTPPPTPTTGVLGATKTKTAPATRTANVAPATHNAAPLATTRSSGTLPFTGAELSVFALVGAALVAAGLLLRRTARAKGLHRE